MDIFSIAPPTLPAPTFSLPACFNQRLSGEFGSYHGFMNNVIRASLSGQSPYGSLNQSLRSPSGNTMNLERSTFQVNQSLNNFNQNLALFQHYNKLFSSCFRSF